MKTLACLFSAIGIVHLPDDEYLVFRTRTATNQLGQVTSANYGRIGEKPNLAIGLSMKACINSAAHPRPFSIDFSRRI